MYFRFLADGANMLSMQISDVHINNISWPYKFLPTSKSWNILGTLQIYALIYTRHADLCTFSQNFQTCGEIIIYMQWISNLCRKNQFWFKKKSKISDICGNTLVFSDLCNQLRGNIKRMWNFANLCLDWANTSMFWFSLQKD